MKDYDRVSLSPPLAKALHNYIQSISSDLTLKEVVGQACMEYLERRKGVSIQLMSPASGDLTTQAV